MDISGIDVDTLKNEEILDLCSDIVDCSSDEISVLQGTDINNLSDDKTQELYEDTMYGTETIFLNSMPLTDEQVLRNNYNTVDMDLNGILLINGQNVDIDKLTENEIADLYNDMLEDNGVLIAATNGSYSCTFTSSTHTNQAKVYTSSQYAYWYCTNVTLDGKENHGALTIWTVGSYPDVWLPRFSGTTMYFKCTGYLVDTHQFCNSTYHSKDSTYGYCYAPKSTDSEFLKQWNACK